MSELPPPAVESQQATTRARVWLQMENKPPAEEIVNDLLQVISSLELYYRCPACGPEYNMAHWSRHPHQ